MKTQEGFLTDLSTAHIPVQAEVTMIIYWYSGGRAFSYLHTWLY